MLQLNTARLADPMWRKHWWSNLHEIQVEAARFAALLLGGKAAGIVAEEIEITRNHALGFAGGGQVPLRSAIRIVGVEHQYPGISCWLQVKTMAVKCRGIPQAGNRLAGGTGYHRGSGQQHHRNKKLMGFEHHDGRKNSRKLPRLPDKRWIFQRRSGQHSMLPQQYGTTPSQRSQDDELTANIDQPGQRTIVVKQP